MNGRRRALLAGLCVAARHTDYLQATLRATNEPGVCTVISTYMLKQLSAWPPWPRSLSETSPEVT